LTGFSHIDEVLQSLWQKLASLILLAVELVGEFASVMSLAQK
jgi:hypothetical protein